MKEIAREEISIHQYWKHPSSILQLVKETNEQMRSYIQLQLHVRTNIVQEQEVSIRSGSYSRYLLSHIVQCSDII
jgi:hypothetical protein